MLFQILLATSLIAFVHSDCGCNKLERPQTQAALENDALSKICKSKSRNDNKYYRDYYPETIENDCRKDSAEPLLQDMSFIPGGEYAIGTDQPHFVEDNESPERLIQLHDFYIDKYEVSNAKFQEYVAATNYTTEAERFGDSFIFKALLTEQQQVELVDFRVASATWWYKVKGVFWKQPSGPDSDLKGLWRHPVTHVSWNDATNYCNWTGKRLPTEVEWEAACRGGKKQKLFPWGNKLMPRGKHWLNIWQGDFPDGNTAEDGFVTTCPVDKFRQNNFDMYNIVGNVWEWTQDLWLATESHMTNPSRVKKGGSFLCHKSYCYRYRCAARSQNTQDSSAGNLGFRCAKDS